MKFSASRELSAPALLPLFRRGTKAYDLLAAIPLCAWFAINGASALQLLAQKTQEFISHPDGELCLTIVSRAAVLLFALAAIGMLLMRSPPTGRAKGLGPRVASFLGTYISVAIVLFLPAAELPEGALLVSAVLILGGMGFSLYAIVYLGRSFSLMAEARNLVTSGPYARVRHPLYVGEELAIIGATIQFISPLAIALLALQMACQFYRMECEEQVLGEAFPNYDDYKARTARLVPGIY